MRFLELIFRECILGRFVVLVVSTEAQTNCIIADIIGSNHQHE